VLGVILGAVTWFGCQHFRRLTKIDDALDVTIVHGLSGAIGSVYIGFCGDHTVNPAGKDGIIYGGYSLIAWQVVAVVSAFAWTAAFTFIILIALDKLLGGLRHRPEDEQKGLDKLEHDEAAYALPPSPLGSQDDLQSVEQRQSGSRVNLSLQSLTQRSRTQLEVDELSNDVKNAATYGSIDDIEQPAR